MSKLISCDCNPQRDIWLWSAGNETKTVFKLYENGDYGLFQEDSDNAIPTDEWCGRTLVKVLGEYGECFRPDESEARLYLESDEVHQLVDNIVENEFSVDWNGNNFVGELTDRGEELLNQILDNLALANENKYSLWNVGEWLEAVKNDLVTWSTTDAEIKTIAEKIESDAKEEFVLIDGDIEEYLMGVRAELYLEKQLEEE